MAKWMVKAAFQDAISLLPCAHRLNMLFQRYGSGRLPLTSRRFEVKLSQCRRHLEYTASSLNGPRGPLTVLELGTGWHPIVPLGMYLCGAATVWTVDIVPLLSADGVAETVGWFVDYATNGRLHEHLPQVQPDRLDVLKDIAFAPARRWRREASRMLREMDIVPIVGDVRDVDLAPGSIDLFISNCVLEHIPADVIRGIFQKYASLASTRAIMSHLVDMADHYADFDRSISTFNFLKYSDRAWRWFNCRLHYQNRLRLGSYRRLHEQTGFEIVQEHNVKGPEAALAAIRLAESFRQIPREELLVVKAWFVSVPRQRD